MGSAGASPLGRRYAGSGVGDLGVHRAEPGRVAAHTVNAMSGPQEGYPDECTGAVATMRRPLSPEARLRPHCSL
ncbi:hypothetical protein [Nocardia sp. SC052]|uniref:hypothetical protein n=1 Tax=Nocardia sichangensis TaxID=3385975 RepID=UPI0039A3BD36